MDSSLLKIREVVIATKLSKATIYRLIRAGRFPLQVRLSTNSVGWRREEVDEWVASRERVSGIPLS